MEDYFRGGPVVLFKWSADENWPVEYVSPNVIQFGYKADDLIKGKVLFSQIVYPGDLERVGREVEEFSSAGVDSFEQDYRVVMSNGEVRWIYDFTNILRNDKGQITHYEGYILDITGRKKTEEELRKSEERFKTVADFAHDWELWLSPQLQMLYCSPSCRQVTGYSKEQFMENANLLKDIVYPDDRGVFLRHLAEEITEVGEYHYEYRIIDSEGNIRWLEHVCVPVFNEEGNYLGRRISNRDITSRKLVEEDLKEIEERIEFAIDATNDGIWDWNLSTGEAYFSPRYFTMLGYHPDELPRQIDTWERLLHPDDRERVLILYNECLDKKRNDFEIEYRLKTKIEDWKWVFSRGKIVEWDFYGRPVRMVGTNQDVSDRKMTEEALRSSGRQYSSIVDHANLGIVLVDSKMELVSVNPRAKEWFPYAGCGAKHFCYKTLSNKHRNTVCEKCPVVQTFKDGLSHESTISFYDGERTRIFSSVSSPIRDNDNNVVLVAEMLNDMTQKVENELLIEELQKQVEELSIPCEKLFVMSGHLLKPLEKIKKSIHTVMDTESKDTNKKFDDLIKSANKQLNILEGQVHSLIDYTHLDTKKVELSKTDLNEVFKKVIQDMNPVIAEKKAQISASNLPVLKTHKDQIYLLFKHLIDNAIKYKKPDDDPKIIIKAEETEGYIHISFHDNGIGILPGDYQKIFDLFSQLNPEHYSGAGMGLPICKKIMEHHGGDIRVESDNGKGTVFYVTFPSGG